MLPHHQILPHVYQMEVRQISGSLFCLGIPPLEPPNDKVKKSNQKKTQLFRFTPWHTIPMNLCLKKNASLGAYPSHVTRQGT